MTTYVALLRAVNVVHHQRVEMAELRSAVEGMGYSGVETLLGSGNLVFVGPPQPTDEVEELLEREFTRRLKLTTDAFVRTAEEWAAIVAHNPFPKEAEGDPSHLLLYALRTVPNPPSWKALTIGISGPEVARGWDRHAYVVYPDGVGRSKVTLPFLEGRLGTRGTGRNWNTVLKLARLTRSQAGRMPRRREGEPRP